jgi:hypothetical protein
MVWVFRMSLRSVDYRTCVQCPCHGSRPGVLMPEPHPAECVECVQYAKVAVTARGRPAPALRVTRAMLCGEGIVCSVCGDPVVSRPTLEQWKAGLNAVWALRDVKKGMSWNNLLPSHFQCRCILGPNAVNTRADCLELWRKAAAAAELGWHASAPPCPRQLVLSKSNVYSITRQHKQLVRRHEVRFGSGTELSAEDLVGAWRAHGGCCAICRESIALEPLTPTLRQLSWDRWDNARGYDAENTRPTCWGCNSAKNMFSLSHCLQMFRQHLAFQAPPHYLPDPGPDVCADEEEVGLVKRLSPIYRLPAECHVRCVMSSEPVSEERVWAVLNAPPAVPSEQPPLQRTRTSLRAGEFRV